MNAAEYATRAGELLEDRGKERDQPDGERSMARCVRTFNAMTGHNLSVEDGWLFMVYLKHARMRGGAFRRDDYEDAVSYEALMAEEATAGSIIPEFEDDQAGEERRERLLKSVFLYRGRYTTLEDLLDSEVSKR